MKGKLKYIIVILNLLWSGWIYGNNKSDLEKQRKEFIDKINYANELLNKNNKKLSNTSANLKLLLSKIDNRRLIISTIENELLVINERTKDNMFVLDNLNSDLENLKQEYAKLVYNSYLNQKTTNIWLFIFASEDFNQFYRRFKYLKEYTKFRKKQKDLIVSVKYIIEDKVKALEEDKVEKQDLLFAYSAESSKLNNEIHNKEKLIGELNREKSRLRSEITKNKEKERRLAGEIARLIEFESKSKNKDKVSADRITNEFLGSEGKLIWPVNKGLVVSKYGSHRHPVLRDVEINNPGIELSTSANSNVLSIYNGEVSGIYGIYGANNTIIVKHGDFYTVYQNVVDVRVKKGTKVSKGDILGKVYTDQNNGETILGFQIWQGKKTVNPEVWIKNN